MARVVVEMAVVQVMKIASGGVAVAVKKKCVVNVAMKRDGEIVMVETAVVVLER